jgi:hypothetical protein
MRQVKARLLKFNGLYGDDDSDESEKNDNKNRGISQSNNTMMTGEKTEIKIQPPILQSSSNPTPLPKPTEKKRESKWGKSSSNETNILMVRH